jgi:phospholipase/carboxylesterase
MPLQTIDIDTGPDPRACVVILHGLGADGNDFVPITQELDLRGVGPIRYVMPSAPVMPVSINGGYRMRAWYDILPTSDLGKREDEGGLRGSCAAITQLIEREIQRGIQPERIVVMGFSQGCAMALMTGLRFAHKLAGIVALSGYLPLPASTQAERHAANAHTPIFMAHGQYDDVVPMARGRSAFEQLLALGHPVEWHDYAMDHSLCLEEVRDLNAWLLKTLAAPA